MSHTYRKGSLFVTKRAEKPDGAVIHVLGFQEDALKTVVDNLNLPDNLICGPDQRLYFSETYVQLDDQRVHRLWRINQDGSNKVLVHEWNTEDIRLIGFVFTPNGDFYFGSVSTQPGKAHQGVWKISNLANTNDSFNPPEQILTPDLFSPPADQEDGAMVLVGGILPTGPFEGDLLIVDSPSVFKGDGTTKNMPIRVLRALSPHFDQVEVFIPERLAPKTSTFCSYFDLSIRFDGHVFITDDEHNNILQFNASGEFLKVFAELDPIHLSAIGPDELVYVTNMEFPQNQPARGGLFVFDPCGKRLASINAPLLFQGVTVTQE